MSKINEHSSGLTDEQVDLYHAEGYLVLPHLLDVSELEPARSAMREKTSEIAEDLYANGLISDKFEDYPFEARLAKLFESLQDHHFLKYGRSWRERRPGYFQLITNPKILDVVEPLIGGEIFANPVYNIRPKMPRGASGARPLDPDESFWPHANSTPVIPPSIPLLKS